MDIEIRRNGSLERTDRIGPEENSAELILLLPLTTYTFTVYVVTNLGRSRPSSINATTLSLSKL